MKALVLILSIFLSVFSGGKVTDVEQREVHSSAVVEAAGQENPEKDHRYHSQAILPIQSARVSGESTNFVPSFRSSNSGRKTQVSQKFPFRVIKAGKIIDRHSFFIFQTQLHQFQSGIHSTSRYIHSICHLLI